jgi:hypothetical protein
MGLDHGIGLGYELGIEDWIRRWHEGRKSRMMLQDFLQRRGKKGKRRECQGPLNTD